MSQIFFEYLGRENFVVSFLMSQIFFEYLGRENFGVNSLTPFVLRKIPTYCIISSMFKDIESVPDFPKYEREILDYWKNIDVISKLKELRSNSPEFVYYDGPITANGRPHYGHAITWTMKDIIPRYQTMKGNYVSRNMGWDCQGILVEVEIEKELGFKHKNEIEAYGIEKFNNYCRQKVLDLKDMITDYEKKFGRFIDHSDEYYTMDPKFIESMWWSIKQLYEKDLIYQDYKVVAYSTRAGTTFSSHEVKDGGYKDLEDDFIIAKFELTDSPNTFLLAFTTTPWTLPGNLLIGLKKDASYSKIKLGEEFYIVASDLVANLFPENPEIVETFSSSEIEGKHYRPLFTHYENRKSEGAFKVVYADHAQTTEGTGLVHLAPYGEEDFEILKALKIKAFDYLDETANFTFEIPEYQGMFYKQANPKIIEDLTRENKVFKYGKLVHRMPVCYRTGTPLIYKPIKSWYLNVEKIKPRLIEENNKINWVPEHVKKGNSGSWIENAKDWCLSRTRYWGTPLPIWHNEHTGELKVFGSFSELEEASGVKLTDPHRPFVDEITFSDPVNGGVFKRIPDIIDVWYDSGSVPFAKVYYPNNQELFEKRFPAKYISESMDQTHLWFYTMLILGVALFDKAPYENVIVTGMMLDKQGKKLSKSKGNYPPVDEVLDNYGADIFRYLVLTSPIVEGEFTRFYEEILKDAKKEFFLIYWNTVKFFTTYAQSHDFVPQNDLESEDVLDKWILTRLKEFQINVTNHMDSYRVMLASRELAPFMNDLSTWYVRRSRDRIKDGDIKALETLYYVLTQFNKICAPFFPFITEKIYEVLNNKFFSKLESVHFEILNPQSPLTDSEQELLENMQKDRGLITSAQALRTQAKISLRQPLATLYSEQKINFPEIFMSELNLKNVIHEKPVFEKMVSNENSTLVLDTNLTQDLINEGKVREFIRKIQDLRKTQKLDVSDMITVTYSENDIDSETLEANLELLKKRLNTSEFVSGEETQISNKVA